MINPKVDEHVFDFKAECAAPEVDRTCPFSCPCALSSSYSTFTYIFLIRIIGPGQCVVWQFAQLITSAL